MYKYEIIYTEKCEYLKYTYTRDLIQKILHLMLIFQIE